MVKLGEPLKDKTTFRIGGSAKLYCQPRDLSDLKLLISSAKKSGIPVFILGAGSNLLISDKGVKGLVLRLNSPYFEKISVSRNYLKVSAGAMLKQVVLAAKNNALSGAEFLAGIPGRLGGALLMNAGAWGKSIGELVENIEVMDYNGKIKSLAANKIKFAYRKSGLEKYIILGARLKLKKENKKEIGFRIKKYLSERFSKQDGAYPNAGCIFKNPTQNSVRKAGLSAGKLIDLCGLKGKSIGGARVSNKHANFILNTGGAKSSDVLKLMEAIKRAVKRKFNLVLEPEIKIWQ